jgi:hypothetical protein
MIDPRYGTNDDYVRLSAAMHKHETRHGLCTRHWGINHWMIKICQQATGSTSLIIIHPNPITREQHNDIHAAKNR